MRGIIPEGIVAPHWAPFVKNLGPRVSSGSPKNLGVLFQSVIHMSSTYTFW